MKLQDALNIFGLQPGATQEDIKAAFKAAALKYHPDRNPEGLEMMKVINNAMDTLKDYAGGEVPNFQQEDKDYLEELKEALSQIIKLNLSIEVCGAWIWVSGNTKPCKDTLKGAGFKWGPQKCMWYFRPEKWRSTSRGTYDMSAIRNKYGSSTVRRERDQDKLAV